MQSQPQSSQQQTGNDDVLIALALLERTIPMLKESTRESIKKNQLNTIRGLIDNSISKIGNYCKEPMVLVPMMEIDKLIEVIMNDSTFVETDVETKEMLSDKIRSSLTAMYLFAGKFYINNDFNYNIGYDDILKRIVDSCMSQGFYFGYDNILMAEGVL